MSLVIPFILKIKGDERTNKDCLWSCLSFITIIEEKTGKLGNAWREMGECGERWNEQDGFLILYIIFL